MQRIAAGSTGASSSRTSAASPVTVNAPKMSPAIRIAPPGVSAAWPMFPFPSR